MISFHDDNNPFVVIPQSDITISNGNPIKMDKNKSQSAINIELESLMKADNARETVI